MSVDPLGLINANAQRQLDKFFGPKVDTSNCVTVECSAGLLPAPIENRTNAQIDRDLKRGACEWACGAALPIPGTSLPKALCEVPKRALEYFLKDVVSGGVCSWVCK